VARAWIRSLVWMTFSGFMTVVRFPSEWSSPSLGRSWDILVRVSGFPPAVPGL
jgi:hypothetical protein